MRRDKQLRRISIVVTARTAKNLERLRDMAGYASTGQAVDKLTRDRMVRLRTSRTTGGEEADIR